MDFTFVHFKICATATSAKNLLASATFVILKSHCIVMDMLMNISSSLMISLSGCMLLLLNNQKYPVKSPIFQPVTPVEQIKDKQKVWEFTPEIILLVIN